MMKYPLIDPAILQIGKIQIRWYGLMYVLGFLAAYIILRKNYKRGNHDLNKQEILDFLTYAIMGVIIGGRLGYCVIYNFPYYFSNPMKFFAVWEGGMSFHGGVLGVFIAGWIFARWRKKPFLMLADMGSLAAPIGLFFGRIGNFINGELYGRVTDVSWGMIFPDAGASPRHPSQLYEAFFEGLLLFMILQWLSSRRMPRGFLFGTFLLGYGVFRFFMEFFREPDPQIGLILGAFTTGQLLCSLMAVCGIYVYWRCLDFRKKG